MTEPKSSKTQADESAAVDEEEFEIDETDEFEPDTEEPESSVEESTEKEVQYSALTEGDLDLAGQVARPLRYC